MNDSDMNPMKTGLMFVPLGQVMSPGFPSPAHGLDRLAELRAATDRGAHAPIGAASSSRRPAFGRLLERLGQFARRRRPATT